ncbi:rhamnose ABC transporter substrate-binding protein [Brucella pseudogrignonensis]|jgi:rhamnose transport system substrate-binding protein|uniref:rhamnose ABC transporter substrate-binding protein n=1 Tax=Brucella TaxID=234 RepID=UPI0007DA6CF3|nr:MULTISPECIES: rhamnose ABC transporter substrate-binding protein [Brucella]MBO1027384.1 rhamnose ABC transporter substrate-binding protein [Ochrobactrum sp. SD129]MQP42750.1 rhamnose ABC transporter substrate-binding protein [Ochrobactrum sp. MYb237]ANG97471.1 rhamnose ABC transporter substrate-binding protein [Brucella pseudogrignonensis]KAB2686538.1 rhamnose ABC transporter substrate-binding protein [Brucella pseudogrignonensis]MCD4513259.1 rhamnose ABC transporter substrate-binding prote
MKLFKKLALSTALAVAFMANAAQAADMKIALVAKSLGNGFFEAANKGAQEAAKELGGVEVIYTGPTTTTAEGQIEVINSLIAQGVDAIAISANDPDAVVPALKKAAQRGIKVISWDSGVAPEGRIVHLNPSSNDLIGKMCLTLAAHHLPDGKGDFAILSATTTSTNQNIWIDEMKKQLKDFPGLNLVTTVYGDDLADKSYREAQGLLTSNPDVKVIVAPTTVGVLAASQAVKDAGKIGDVYVTGLGLPSEMAGAIKSGATKEFAIWNPIDLGYSATQIAYHLVKGDADGKPGSEIEAGRMGKIKIGENGEAAMSDPFVYDASNIDEFSKVF